jgi:hypothetical protein
MDLMVQPKRTTVGRSMRSFPNWKRVADWMARASGEMALCLSLVGGIRSANVSWSTIKRSMAGTGTINSPIVNGDVRKPRLPRI